MRSSSSVHSVAVQGKQQLTYSERSLEDMNAHTKQQSLNTLLSGTADQHFAFGS